MPDDNSRKTISDVADALGISKTTVSRAISGKGRVGEATRKRVLEYIEKYNYKPNPMAKGLAQQRSYNLAWVIPGDSSMSELPFFQSCLMGICQEAEASDYDVIVAMVYENDNSSLIRVVNGNKVDGVLLGRTLVDDVNVKYLKESGIPFAVIGSSYEDGVIQIDNNHLAACEEFTEDLIEKGYKRISLVGGNNSHVVNRIRREGFERAVKACGKELDANIYMESLSIEDIDEVVKTAAVNNTELLICMDDNICNQVINKLRESGIKYPDKISVASMYDSELLSNFDPGITAIKYSPRRLGATACKVLMDMIEGEEVSEKTLLNVHTIITKGSTR